MAIERPGVRWGSAMNARGTWQYSTRHAARGIRMNGRACSVRGLRAGTARLGLRAGNSRLDVVRSTIPWTDTTAHCFRDSDNRDAFGNQPQPDGLPKRRAEGRKAQSMDREWVTPDNVRHTTARLLADFWVPRTQQP